MTLQQLRYFCEIAARGWNISEAARALHTSQPGVSRQMQFLEDELGIAIFARRNTRLIGVTEAGRTALALAQRIVGEVENLKKLHSRFDEGAGRTLAIAATHTQARYVLPSIVKEFTRTHPGVEVMLKQGIPHQVVKRIERGEADISICAMPPSVPDEVVMFPFAIVERIAVVPAGHPLANRSKVTLREIADFPLITYDVGFTGRSAVLGTFEHAGLDPRIAISAVDTDVMKAYAAQGLGVAIMSEVAFNPATDADLCSIPVSDVFGRDTIYLGLRRYSHLRRMVGEFIALFAPHLDLGELARALNSPPTSVGAQPAEA